MKVTLLFPTFNEEYSLTPPLGVAYLAAVLKKAKINVNIIDASKYKDYKEYLKEIKSIKPDILGISFTSIMFEKACKAAELTKKVLPKIKIIFGGPHVTNEPLGALKLPYLDMVVYGEGEYTMLEIAQNKPLSKIKGLCYKKGNKLIKNLPRPLIENLDELSYPARDLLPMEKYLANRPTMPLPYPATTIMPSRGCVFNCTFCQPTLTKLFGRRIRYRSVKNVVNEMIYIKNKYNLKGIYFADDEPTINSDWMINLCREIIKRKLKVRWTCASRVDTVKEEMLRWMKKAGCVAIGFGVESGSQKILDVYRKGITIEQIKKAFKLCRKVGIIARANFMVGALEDTTQTVEESIKLIKQIKPDLIYTAVTTPIFGTDLYNQVKERGLIRNKKQLRLYIGTMHRETLSDQQIKQLMKKIVKIYKTQLINPIYFFKRTYLWKDLILYWLSLFKKPKMIFKGLFYYFNYGNKEKL